MNLGINDHTSAVNITAPQSICTLCFRPMPATDVETILQRIQDSANQFGLDVDVRSRNPAFRRDPQSEFMQQCIKLASGNPPRTVAYGSESSNFTHVENLIVLGPGDIAQAHKSDEWVTIDQLHQGGEVYGGFIREFCL